MVNDEDTADERMTFYQFGYREPMPRVLSKL
jgi:hypothetical protein